MKLLIIDRRTLLTQRASSVEQADEITREDSIGEEEIEWALEEHGRCDGMHFTIIPEEWEEE